eukprot:2720525-Prymnesium_polylepis.2
MPAGRQRRMGRQASDRRVGRGQGMERLPSVDTNGRAPGRRERGQREQTGKAQGGLSHASFAPAPSAAASVGAMITASWPACADAHEECVCVGREPSAVT